MAEWDGTQIMKKRLKNKIYVSKGRDHYQDRPVIHRDSLVDGGVYLGESQREAIVVDSQKLREFYEKARARVTKNVFRKKEKIILQAVYDTVTETIPKKDLEYVKRVVQRYDASKDVKIRLDVFLEEGIGGSRHGALTCAALLELFKKDGIIKGKPSVDRNSVVLDGDVRDRHVWCRYTNPKGKIFILDVKKGFVGKLSRASKETGWPYERPEDF